MTNPRTAIFFGPLESLRGAAALIVAIHHANWWHPIGALPFMQNAALMVDFFFVLSGFIICHRYGHRLSSLTDLLRFMWLRFGRLYPLHLAFLLVFLLIETAKLVAEMHFGIEADKPAFTVNGPAAFFSNLFLLQSLGFHDSLTYNFPAWSISTEFYTYALFSILVLAMGPRSLSYVGSVLIAGALGILVANGQASFEVAGVDFAFIRCVAGFFFGVLAYRVYARTAWRFEAPGFLQRWIAPAALVVVIAVLSIKPRGQYDPYVMPLFAFLVWSFGVARQTPVIGFLQIRALTWLGTISYSIYMSHAAVVWGLKQFLTLVLHQPKVMDADPTEAAILTSSTLGTVFLAVYVAIVLLLSSATYLMIEKPLRDKSRILAARWFPAPSSEALARLAG